MRSNSGPAATLSARCWDWWLARWLCKFVDIPHHFWAPSCSHQYQSIRHTCKDGRPWMLCLLSLWSSFQPTDPCELKIIFTHVTQGKLFLLVSTVLLDTLHQLPLVAKVHVPLPRNDGVSHHLVHRLVLGQKATVATCLFLLLGKEPSSVVGGSC